MRTDTTTLSRSAARPRTRTCKVRSAPKVLNHIRHSIESTDWDEELILQEKWIDRICLSIIVLSVVYFIPIVLFSLLT